MIERMILGPKHRCNLINVVLHRCIEHLGSTGNPSGTSVTQEKASHSVRSLAAAVGPFTLDHSVLSCPGLDRLEADSGREPNL